jgi:hypothetical protein
MGDLQSLAIVIVLIRRIRTKHFNSQILQNDDNVTIW